VSWVGIDIGGTKIHVVVCDEELRILAATRGTTPVQAGARVILQEAARLTGDLLTELRLPITAAGVGASGVVDPVTGAVASSTATFTGWSGELLRAIVQDLMKVPAVVDNDGNAALYAEAKLGAAAGAAHALAVVVGTGVGGAVLTDGRLVHGRHGAAGEFGHLPVGGDAPCPCGGRGHLESVAAGPALARAYRQRTGQTVTGSDVTALARAGDLAAAAVLNDAATILGRAVAGLANALDPDVVVLGGGVLDAADLVLRPLRAAAAEHLLPPLRDLPIVRAQLGSDAVAVGAAALARDSQIQRGAHEARDHDGKETYA
jgi:glucokinase